MEGGYTMNVKILHMSQRYRHIRQIQYTHPWGSKPDPSSGQEIHVFQREETIPKRMGLASEGEGREGVGDRQREAVGS